MLFVYKLLTHFYFTRLVLPHIVLVIFIVAYCLLGAYVFFILENPSEEERKLIGRQYLFGNISDTVEFMKTYYAQKKEGPLINYSQNEKQTLNPVRERIVELLKTYEYISSTYSLKIDDNTNNANEYWSYASSVLFAFTVITTIGYGNLAPVTLKGKLFCILYGLIGIPLTMVAIADVGQFLAEGIGMIFKRIKNKIQSLCTGAKKKRGKENQSQENNDIEEPQTLMGAVVVSAAFVCYILIGATCLPIWEDFGFSDGCYFAFVTITTVGLGDIVPKKLDFLFPTIVYIVIGLAITTLTIEVMSQYLRQIHFVGSEVKGSKDVYVWFGNRMLTVGELVGAIGERYGIPKGEINDLKHKFDTVVTHTVEEKAARKRALASKSNTKFETHKISRAPLFDDIEFRYIDEESLADLPATIM